MASPLRDPKALTEWIELDYFRRRRRWSKQRRWLTWGAFVLGVAVLVPTLWPRYRSVYEAGPLSTAHKMFSSNCAACHTEHFQTVQRLWHGDTETHSVPDAACMVCHQDMPLHNDRQTFTPECASCHQEHRNRPVLAHVADGHCTACHRDLAKSDKKPPQLENVSAFLAHPEFRLWRNGERDPGTVRFNHKVHLNLQDESVRGIGEPLARLRREQCRYCHRPDPAGRTMQPIDYQSHCAACHPLGVQVLGAAREPAVAAAAEDIRKTPAPHTDPTTVRAVLRERYLQFARAQPAAIRAAPEEPVPPRLFPGKRPPAPVTRAEWEWTERQLHDAERVLFQGAGGCRYCHDVRTAAPPADLPVIAPAQITERWLKKSIFSHERHREWECKRCHEGAATSERTADVLLPRIESCRQCHNPAVGARSDCAECHQYHNRNLAESLDPVAAGKDR